METKRLILFVVFSFSLLLLWDSWQKEQFKNIPVEESTNTQDATIPSASTNLQDNTEKPESSFRLADSAYINVKTDLYKQSYANSQVRMTSVCASETLWCGTGCNLGLLPTSDETSMN